MVLQFNSSSVFKGSDEQKQEEVHGTVTGNTPFDGSFYAYHQIETLHANTSKRNMSFKVAFILYEHLHGPVGRLDSEIEALCCARIHFSLLN